MEALQESPASQPEPTLNVEPPPARFNFAAHLFHLNRARAGKPAYIDDRGVTTYGQLEEQARRFAAVLPTLGVHAEERVLLVMQDSVELPVVFLGALYAGVVPVVANTLLTPADYVYMLTHSHARVVIASGAVLPALEQALSVAEHDGCLLIVSQPSDGDGDAPHAPVLSALLEAATPAPQSPSPAAATTSPSGSIRQVRPVSPKARCIPTRISTGPPSCTASRSSASSKAMWCFPPPSCSLPMVSATD